MSIQDDIFDIESALTNHSPELVEAFDRVLVRLNEAEEAEDNWEVVQDALTAIGQIFFRKI